MKSRWCVQLELDLNLQTPQHDVFFQGPTSTSSLQVTLTSKAIHLYLYVYMSIPPPGNQKSSLLRPFKGLLSRRSRSPSPQGAQSVTPHIASASISATSAPQVPQGTHSPSPQGAQPLTPQIASASISATSAPQDPRGTHSPFPQGAQSVTPHISSVSIPATSAPHVNPQGICSPSPQGAQSQIASASISATSAPQINPQGAEYTAILALSPTPPGLQTREHRMKEWGSTAYEGLKTAIQGIYDCSSIFPPLQVTAGGLLTISKIVDVCGSLCSACNYVIDVSFYPSESFSK